jgi:hypothetical protein
MHLYIPLAWEWSYFAWLLIEMEVTILARELAKHDCLAYDSSLKQNMHALLSILCVM